MAVNVLVRARMQLVQYYPHIMRENVLLRLHSNLIQCFSRHIGTAVSADFKIVFIILHVLIKETEICFSLSCLKGLSHEILRPVFWPVWMHLGLNVNRLWF